jgi:hypothetical protein
MGPPDLMSPFFCSKNSDCLNGKVCVPEHNGCHSEPPNDDLGPRSGGPCADHLTSFCQEIDLDPSLTCVITGDTTSCDCTWGSCF